MIADGRPGRADRISSECQPDMPDDGGDACFTYGSLMCADIMARVVGRALLGEPARLAGHSRHPVRGETYPGVVEDPRGWVDGRLYRGVDAAALARLDAFEGGLYARRPVPVNPVGGGSCMAWCYIFRDEYRHLLRPGDWDFAAFLAAGKAEFEARYLGFEALD
jgi:gamma-glutamylcyclotransferase (GGCT)/AIG2-like uncharacterized protein YtfP